MTDKELVLGVMAKQGNADALNLRARSPDMDGTGVIDEESKIPTFEPDKDCSAWPAGSPVREKVDEEYQVFKLLQPHNASHYEGTPSMLPALWSICHTKDPAKAKPYQTPHGTSGLWMLDECCTESGRVYRSLVDNGAYAPSEFAANWEDLRER